MTCEPLCLVASETKKTARVFFTNTAHLLSRRAYSSREATRSRFRLALLLDLELSCVGEQVPSNLHFLFDWGSVMESDDFAGF